MECEITKENIKFTIIGLFVIAQTSTGASRSKIRRYLPFRQQHKQNVTLCSSGSYEEQQLMPMKAEGKKKRTKLETLDQNSAIHHKKL